MAPLTVGMAVVLAAVAGVAARPAVSIEARACPGLGEVLLAAVAFVAPNQAMSSWLVALNGLAIVGAALIVGLIVRTLLDSAAIAASVAVAFLLSTPMLARLDPAQPAAMLIGALALALFFLDGRRATLAVPASGAATAVLLPSQAVPLACVAAAALWQRPGSRRHSVLRVAGALVGIPLLSIAAVWFSPAAAPALGCVTPSVAEWSAPADAVATLALAFGPFAVGLMVLGLVARVPDPVPSGAWLLAGGYAAASIIARLWSPDASWAALAPAVVVGWMFVAFGMRKVVSACSPGVFGRVAAVLLLALLPVLQRSTWRDEPLIPPAPSAAAPATQAAVLDVLRQLPRGSLIHREDLVTDALVSAATHWHPDTPTVELTTVDPLAPEHRVVLAFPRAARRLQQRGFAPDTTAAPGLTRLEWRGGCAPIGGEWDDVPELRVASSLAAVASRPDERGPMVIYLEFDSAPDIHPRGWAPVELRGYHVLTFDSASPESARELAQLAAGEGLSIEPAGPSGPHVARIEVFRTPVSTDALVVDLGTRPQRIRARVTAPAGEPRTYALCAAFP